MPHSQPAKVAVAAELARVLPQRHEGVLQDVGHDLGVVAPSHQPGLQPGGVPVVELLQRAVVRLHHPRQQDAGRPLRSVRRGAVPRRWKAVMPTLSHRRVEKVPDPAHRGTEQVRS